MKWFQSLPPSFLGLDITAMRDCNEEIGPPSDGPISSVAMMSPSSAALSVAANQLAGAGKKAGLPRYDQGDDEQC